MNLITCENICAWVHSCPRYEEAHVFIARMYFMLKSHRAHLRITWIHVCRAAADSIPATVMLLLLLLLRLQQQVSEDADRRDWPIQFRIVSALDYTRSCSCQRSRCWRWRRRQRRQQQQRWWRCREKSEWLVVSRRRHPLISLWNLTSTLYSTPSNMSVKVSLHVHVSFLSICATSYTPK